MSHLVNYPLEKRSVTLAVFVCTRTEHILKCEASYIIHEEAIVFRVHCISMLYHSQVLPVLNVLACEHPIQ